MVWYSNGWFMCYELDQYIREQDGIDLSSIQRYRLSGIQIPDHLASNLFLTIFIPN